MSDRPAWFGEYGGRFVPETLMEPLRTLEGAWRDAQRDPDFARELAALHRDFTGRPTPLTFAPRLSAELDVQVYLKREDLAHTGAHKINNCLGQALLTRRMGKRRIIAETGAGQHGVATATVAAKFGLDCTIYMGEEDTRRQALNVFRMRTLGAEVRPVASGTRTLKDAINEAMRDWVTNVQGTHYLLGSVLGPHPFPTIVRDLQSIIGEEARVQIQEAEGRLPDLLLACVGGGSNAIGLFHRFLGDQDVRMMGVEAGGRGDGPGEHAARFDLGSVGILHGTRTFVLQDEHGNILPTHSVSAGLDYPAVGPEHAALRAAGRVEYGRVGDAEAVAGFHRLAELEGILPALETSHAVAWLMREGRGLPSGTLVILNLSGRGDKDVETVAGEGDMSRVEAAFRLAERENRAAFVAYLTAGDPTPQHTPALVEALVDAGADVIELGVPFSDPLADGPVNQRAAERALAAGTTLSGVLEIVEEVRRRTQVPVVLFSYFNPIHRMGVGAFAARARSAGVDGLLLTDLAAEDAGDHLPPLREADIDSVFLLAPTTKPERIGKVTAESRGFVYYVSRTGVTGDPRELSSSLAAEIAIVRQHTALPIAVGFGIATPEQVAATAAIADGVVVGSALVQRIERYGADRDLPERLGEFARVLARATRR